MSAESLRLYQVAISTVDLRRSHHWYRRALGFQGAGVLRHREVEGPGTIADLPELSLDVWCLVDRQEWSQFELIEFHRPRMRSISADWRASDFGYTTIGLHAADFDAALARLARTSGRLLGAPLGRSGTRRVCLRDPDGVLLELMEDDVRAGTHRARPNVAVPVTLRSITVSVPEIDVARRFWIEGLGLTELCGVELHRSEHESLWGLSGATRHSVLLDAGDALVELACYDDPVGRARPAGALLSDQGILNIALGTEDREAFDVVYQRLLSMGYRANAAPWTLKNIATVVYMNDEQGNSVELLHVEDGGKEYMGFVPNQAG